MWGVRKGRRGLPIEVELKVLVMRSAGMESSPVSWMISGDRAWMSIIEKLRQQDDQGGIQYTGKIWYRVQVGKIEQSVEAVIRAHL